MRFAFAVLAAALSVLPASADLIVSRGLLGVEHFTDAGSPLGILIAPGTGGLTDARGVAVAPSGDIFISDFANNNILKFDAGGVFQSIFASGLSVDVPLGLAFGTAGDLFVASAGGISNIARVDPLSGAVLNGNFTSGNVTPVGGPQHLTFGPTLALTDFAGHLFRFDAMTGVVISTGILDNPVGVAFNAGGDLFVAQRISNNVLKFPSGGGATVNIIPNGSFAGSPTALAMGPDGLLYLEASTAIYRFDVSGTNGVLVDSFGSGGQFLAFTSTVPEPGTWTLALLPLVLLLWRSARRA